jgi:hypothetical protein
MSNTVKILVKFKGKTIGLILISENPADKDGKIATISPVTKTGKWKNGDATMVFERSAHWFYSKDKPNVEIQEDITKRAGIEPGEVRFVPII